MQIKQWIIIRKDLKMRKGKIAAQASHASMKIFFDRIEEWHEHGFVVGNLTTDMISWARGNFTKICLYVESEGELLSIYKEAQDAKLPSSLIEDSGLTEFNNVPTLTAVAIGPVSADKVLPIIGRLKLL